MKASSKYIREPGNFLTHFFPALFALPAGAIIIAQGNGAYKFAAATIYAIATLLLFTVSTLYHSLPKTPEKIRFWQKIDHCSIYCMIAGSFTPTALLIIDGKAGASLTILVWLIALIGCILKFANRLTNEVFSTFLYIGMGCLILPFFSVLKAQLPLAALLWLALGGVFYIGGTYFFIKDKRISRFLHCHQLWHLFVVAGATSHYVYNFIYILN